MGAVLLNHNNLPTPCVVTHRLAQEEVQIEHVEADEARRQAEVQAGIIQQVCSSPTQHVRWLIPIQFPCTRKV